MQETCFFTKLYKSLNVYQRYRRGKTVAVTTYLQVIYQKREKEQYRGLVSGLVGRCEKLGEASLVPQVYGSRLRLLRQ
jgi:hypothetical protein